jgi:hypothetical protein
MKDKGTTILEKNYYKDMELMRSEIIRRTSVHEQNLHTRSFDEGPSNKENALKVHTP